jgi:hypothetical protein
MTKYRRLYVKISRVELIQRLAHKEFGKRHSTAEELLIIIKKYNLQRYKKDGKRRNKEVLTRAVALAYKSLTAVDSSH